MKYTTHKILSYLLISLFVTNNAYSDTNANWCEYGTKVLLSDNNWDEETILANFPGDIDYLPDWYTDSTVTSDSVENYANSFVGGGGEILGYAAPNSGEVHYNIYSPSLYPDDAYNTNMGINFRIVKCYTIAPMTKTKSQHVQHPGSPGSTGGYDDTGMVINVTPLDELDSLCHYWDIVDPDDDDDEKEDDDDRMEKNGYANPPVTIIKSSARCQ